MKITFLGAGSSVFVRNVIGDCMLTEGLHDALYSLYDIDAGRLNDSYNMLVNINANSNGGNAVFEKYVGVENLEDALRDSDFVINAVQVGGYEPCTVTDFEIPKKYGLRQTIADTLGVGGVFRALRTIPVMQMFAEKIEKVCPKALFMNYSNPMSLSLISSLAALPVSSIFSSVAFKRFIFILPLSSSFTSAFKFSGVTLT